MKNLTTVMGEEINRGITEMYMDALQETDVDKITYRLKQLKNTERMVVDNFVKDKVTFDENCYLIGRIEKAIEVVNKHLDFIIY